MLITVLNIESELYVMTENYPKSKNDVVRPGSFKHFGKKCRKNFTSK